MDEKLKKAYPNRNVIKLRSQIKLYFFNSSSLKRRATVTEHGGNFLDDCRINSYIVINEKSDEDIFEETKFHTYKPYFQLLSTKLDLKVIESFERDETEEEIKKRKEEREEVEKNRLELLKKDKKNVKPIPKKSEDFKEESLKINVSKPSSINFGEKYPRFSKWLASLFQVIQDLCISDCNVVRI